MQQPSPRADDRPERVVPFPARGIGEPDPPRRTNRPRRARHRRQNTPWLQRNALSVAAVSVLVALLGLGFGLAQVLTRSEPTPSVLAVATAEPTAGLATTASMLSASPAGQAPEDVPATDGDAAPRPIQANAATIQANYTVQAGDTLARIAARYNTTVERIQAFNNLSDPRALRVGTKLVIPPPL